MLAGVFNSIPYFGAVIVCGDGGRRRSSIRDVEMALIVSRVAFAITTLEGFRLTPWLTSRAARMNAVAVFVGLLFWGWVGNVGDSARGPMLMVIKAICDHVEDFKGFGELLGE